MKLRITYTTKRFPSEDMNTISFVRIKLSLTFYYLLLDVKANMFILINIYFMDINIYEFLYQNSLNC